MANMAARMVNLNFMQSPFKPDNVNDHRVRTMTYPFQMHAQAGLLHHMVQESRYRGVVLKRQKRVACFSFWNLFLQKERIQQRGIEYSS